MLLLPGVLPAKGGKGKTAARYFYTVTHEKLRKINKVKEVFKCL